MGAIHGWIDIEFESLQTVGFVVTSLAVNFNDTMLASLCQ